MGGAGAEDMLDEVKGRKKRVRKDIDAYEATRMRVRVRSFRVGGFERVNGGSFCGYMYYGVWRVCRFALHVSDAIIGDLTNLRQPHLGRGVAQGPRGGR